ncbi:MAG: long-chain fatty acid--CoA ligase, partial [Deltaproteobacteria bacterium]|nr:long-chain fatty acid--CoA ligase [Deltaproteobacteria bacterium]
MTIPQVLARNAAQFGEARAAVREKAYGIWRRYSWSDYYRYVQKTAGGFAALNLGRGQVVCLIVENHAEWLFCEIAAHSLGASTLNLFTSSVADELCASILRANCSIVVAQDQEQVDKLLEIKDKLKQISKVVYIDPTGMSSYESNPWLIGYAQLLEEGEQFLVKNESFFEKEIKKGSPEDVAVMIQTSGTTGIPKLAMLSHRNFMQMAAQWIISENIKPEDNWLSISPPAWIVDQMWGVGVALLGAMTMNFPETPETVKEDFRDIGPSMLITASRFWEDLASEIRVRISDSGWIKKKLFFWGDRIGKIIVNKETRKQKISLSLNILHKIMKILVYRPLLDRIGCSKFQSAFTGGHPISPDVILFFRAIGLNLKQCYGLTEAGGIFQVQPNNE